MEKQVNYKAPIERLRRLLSEERKMIYLIFTYAIINGIIVLTIPLGIQAILNFILGGRVSSSWVILVFIVITGLTVSGWVQIVQLSLTEKLQQRIFAKSSFEIAVRLPRIKLEALHDQYTPQMINRFFDTVNLQKGIAKLLVELPTSTLQVFFGFLLIALYHPFFVLFSIGVIIFLFLLFKYTGPKGIRTSLQESTKKYDVANWLEELARTPGTFKLGGISNLPLFRIDKLLAGYLHFRNEHFGVLLRQYKIMIALKVVTISSLIVLGSLLLIDNQISLGQFVAAEIIVILIMNSIEKIILSLETVYDVLASVEKLGSITDLPLEEDVNENSQKIVEKNGFSIGVENLEFTYPGSSFPTIRNLSFKLAKSEKVCLLGPSGSGKSTLLQLICGFYEVFKGRITYNDIPLSALQLNMLRMDIGANVWQETIFHGTLRENVSLSKDGVSDEMIYTALEKVGAIPMVNLLSEGLNTMLYPEGLKLSRVLVSKLILARAIVSIPKLLILQVDADIFTNLEKQVFYDYLFAQSWSIIGVSRDEDFIKKCNRTLILDAGSILFSGDYKSLKASNHVEFIR
ncbi:ATP-binding cassette domain-containing protein [Cryomorpha ignava]|uniref:ATP-binding cassette domain-containing protein n=1 Tax=Cryomorpha ignava TaxID=101383 RepID=A0A7K3WN60_9FLAO|nr:ATP-binding cassette domain-containing protein [Cryomorpha ignava]NEN23087.1 ATP-binding cassette domain-containing protein [Cryomorpha ignava]